MSTEPEPEQAPIEELGDPEHRAVFRGKKLVVSDWSPVPMSADRLRERSRGRFCATYSSQIFTSVVIALKSENSVWCQSWAGLSGPGCGA